MGDSLYQAERSACIPLLASAQPGADFNNNSSNWNHKEQKKYQELSSATERTRFPTQLYWGGSDPLSSQSFYELVPLHNLVLNLQRFLPSSLLCFCLTLKLVEDWRFWQKLPWKGSILVFFVFQQISCW